MQPTNNYSMGNSNQALNNVLVQQHYRQPLVSRDLSSLQNKPNNIEQQGKCWSVGKIPSR